MLYAGIGTEIVPNVGKIFERTLLPLVFHRACQFECYLYPQALLSVGRLVFLRLALK